MNGNGTEKKRTEIRFLTFNTAASLYLSATDWKLRT